MTWVTWQQYRHQAAFAAALLAALAVVLLITGLHAAAVWHSALTHCTTGNSCSGLAGSNLSLGSPVIAWLAVATAAVPALPALLWGAPAVASELETGTNQFAWTQSITRRRWLAVRSGWLLLAAALLGGVVSAIVTWWSGPYNALTADAFQVNRFDVTGIVPAGYAIFAMALGICAGTLLRRTLPALGITLAGFGAIRVVIALWLRLRYLAPVTVHYKLTAPFTPPGSYLLVTNGFVSPDGKPAALDYAVPNYNGVPLPPACLRAMRSNPNPQTALPCLAAHGYQGSMTYQPASQPLLGLPGHRDEHLRHPRRHPDRHRLLGPPPPGRITRTRPGQRRSRHPRPHPHSSAAAAPARPTAKRANPRRWLSTRPRRRCWRRSGRGPGTAGKAGTGAVQVIEPGSAGGVRRFTQLTIRPAGDIEGPCIAHDPARVGGRDRGDLGAGVDRERRGRDVAEGHCGSARQASAGDPDPVPAGERPCGGVIAVTAGGAT